MLQGTVQSWGLCYVPALRKEESSQQECVPSRDAEMEERLGREEEEDSGGDKFLTPGLPQGSS